jgi:hypothetical protein
MVFRKKIILRDCHALRIKERDFPIDSLMLC